VLYGPDGGVYMNLALRGFLTCLSSSVAIIKKE
jgi:hypothetical protein